LEIACGKQDDACDEAVDQGRAVETADKPGHGGEGGGGREEEDDDRNGDDAPDEEGGGGRSRWCVLRARHGGGFDRINGMNRSLLSLTPATHTVRGGSMSPCRLYRLNISGSDSAPRSGYDGTADSMVAAWR